MTKKYEKIVKSFLSKHRNDSAYNEHNIKLLIKEAVVNQVEADLEKYLDQKHIKRVFENKNKE